MIKIFEEVDIPFYVPKKMIDEYFIVSLQLGNGYVDLDWNIERKLKIQLTKIAKIFDGKVSIGSDNAYRFPSYLQALAFSDEIKSLKKVKPLYIGYFNFKNDDDLICYTLMDKG